MKCLVTNCVVYFKAPKITVLRFVNKVIKKNLKNKTLILFQHRKK